MTEQRNATTVETAVSKPVPIEVEPARLADGAWCHRRNKMIGQGDISASYSADRIAESKPIRKPFDWQGATWVCTGKMPHGEGRSATVYRLIDPGLFEEAATTFGGRARKGDAAREDPKGFYHGVTVTHAKRGMVLCGPPALLVPGKAAQLELF